MTRIEKLNNLQDQIVHQTYIERRCTLELCTGSGKSIISAKSLYRKREEGMDINNVLIMAENSLRESIFEEEYLKFNKIFNKDIYNDFNIDFACYQSLPDLSKYDIIIADEAHEMITASRFRLLSENTDIQWLLLTATTKENLNIFTNRDTQTNLAVYQSDDDTENKKVTELCTKGQFYEMFAPIKYRLPLHKAIELGVLSRYETTVIEHTLDNKHKKHVIWKTYNTIGTELLWYQKKKRWADQFWLEPKELRRITNISHIPRFLYNLPSKVPVCKELKEYLEARNKKTLFFAKDSKILREFLEEDQLATRQTANKKNKSNKDINVMLDKFRDGELLTLGSSQLLKQGVSLPSIDTLILVSYDSNPENMEQILGRLVRFKQNKIGKVLIFVTNDTLEEKWFNKLSSKKDSKGKHKSTLNLNVNKVVNSEKLLNDLKRLNNESR